MNFITHSIGMLLLALFLIAYGLAGLGVPLGVVPAILALIAGIILLVRR